MGCKSKVNSLKFLRNKGIIDEYNRINDLEKFHKANNYLHKLAEKKYDLFFSEPLFKIEKSQRKLLAGSSSRRNSTQVIHRVIPNEAAFLEIDKKMVEKNKENAKEDSDIDYFEDIEVDNSILEPDYEKYLNYKINLKSRLLNRLAKIKNEKKKFASDKEKLKELIELENEINKRVKGSVELNIDGIETEIEKLKNNPPIQKFNYYTERDFERLDKISKSEEPEDLKEARNIINFYEALGTFDVKETHPLFSMEDIFNENGELILDKSVVDNFLALREKAKSYQNLIEQKEKKTIVDSVNTNTKIKNLYENSEFDYDTLFYKKDGLKDTPWMDMFLMDITNGIFSQNGIIPQVMVNRIQNSFESNLVYAKSVENRVNDIQKKVEKELSDLGYSIKVPGIKGVSYDLFRAVDENGQFKDQIVQRFSNSFINERKKMLLSFDRKMKKAQAIEDPVQKTNKIKEAYFERDNWYRKNTIVLDIRKIPEVINSEDFKKLKDYFNVEESESYKKELIEILGENGYKEEIDKQLKLLKEYETMYEVFKENIITREGVEDYSQLSDKSKNEIEIWEKRNDPFAMLNSYYNGNEILQGKLKLNSTMSYNYSVPRKNKVKLEYSQNKKTIEAKNLDQETDYYDERFKTIDSNETLKEFHNLLSEVQEKIYNTMPIEVRKKFNAYSLPVLEKSLTEILFDKNISLFKRLSTAAREIYDRIRALFGMNIQQSLSYATVDPITGKPDYTVNSDFLKSNKREIEQRYTIEAERLKKLLGLSPTTSINQFKKFNIKNEPKVLKALEEIFGVNSQSELNNRLKSEDFENIELFRILKDGITHQVVSEKSFDLPKMLKLFSYMTMEYAARQEVLPTLEMIKQHYEEIKQPSITNTGKKITNVKTKETRLEGERKNAVKQMDSWFERVVLGNYGSKNELGDTTIKREAKIRLKKSSKLTEEEQKKSFLSKMETTIDGRIYNTDEKILKGKIPDIIKHLESYLEEVKDNPEEAKKVRNKINEVNNIEKNLGKHFSATSFFDALFNFIRFKGLGWNLSSNITNFAEGQIANMIVAASGDYFKSENIYRANDIVKGSFLKNISIGKIATDGAKKTRVLMDRYAILQDASNELQKASSKSAFSSFSTLSPYEGTKRTEYLNQAPLMIAVLLDQKILDKEGKESNVWDAMNPDGSLKEEFRSEENIENWENANGQQYNDYKSHMRKLIVNAHGDYDELRGNMASEYISGKALLMFKRWMSRQFYQRFAMTPQSDLEVGIKDYKGRYLSHTKVSGFLHGAIIGFGGLGLLGSGPLGLLIGGGVGLTLGKFYGANTGMNFLKELSFVSKELFMNMVRIPVNNIVGKQVIKDGDYSKLEKEGKISERDVKNMRSNLIDMSITLAWLALLLFTKGLLWDDEDEKDDPKRKAHNLLANRFMQLSSQASMYLDPVETWNNTVGNLPILKFFTEVGKTAEEAQDFLEGQDTIPTGPNAGESALYNQIEKTFFPGAFKGVLGFESHMKKQFRASAFDQWFYGDEKKAKKDIQQLKAKTKNEFLKEELTEDQKKDITKKINKFYKKSKDESYVDVLKRIEDQDFSL